MPGFPIHVFNIKINHKEQRIVKMNNSIDIISSSSFLKSNNLLAQAAYIQAGFSKLPKDLSHDGLLLIGPSGSGKSTIATYMLSTPLMRWTYEIYSKLTSQQRDEYKKRRIGHVYPKFNQNSENLPQINGVGSTTTHITAYNSDELLVIDTPGFDDTDSNRVLANALMLEQIIQKSKKIKLGIVIDYSALDAGQGLLFQRLTELLSQLFFPEQLYHCLKNNNILFLFTDKSGNHLHADILRHALEQATETLKSRKSSAGTLDTENQLAKQIEICQILCQVSDERLLFVNPLDEGESREQILQAVRAISPVDNSIFNFNTPEKVKFKDELRENFILPYLHLMRCERITHELDSLDRGFYSKLSEYKSLSTKKRSKKINLDLTAEEEKLSKDTSELEQLKIKLQNAQQQLQNDLRPEEEIVFVTMSGENRAYTLVEQTSISGVVAATGFAGYSAYLAACQASAATLFTSSGGSLVVTAAGFSFTCTSTATAIGIITGFAMIPAAVILGGSLLVKQYSTRYIENNYPLPVTYSGTRFTRTEIRYKTITPKNEKTPVDYYEIDPTQIILSPDQRVCTAKFRKKSALGTQRSQVLCVLGKRENHPEFEPFITGLKNEIAELNAEIMKYERRIAMSQKIIDILKILQANQDDSTLESLLAMQSSKEEEKQNYLNDLNEVQQELEAINIILSYIAVTGILFDYQKEYTALQHRHRKFSNSAVMHRSQNVSLKSMAPLERESSISSKKDPVELESSNDEEEVEVESIEVKEENLPLAKYQKHNDNKDVVFLNAIKEKIKQYFDTYLDSKTADKREMYKQKVARSLDFAFLSTEFQHLVLNDYYSHIPEIKIPQLREKNEYLLSLLIYQKKIMQDIYKPIKQSESQSASSQFAVNLANYIQQSWSACIVLENSFGETEEEQNILNALHNRMRGYFQHYKPTISAGTFSLTKDRLTRVLSSLENSVFKTAYRRREILQFYHSLDEVCVPNNEEKWSYLLNVVKSNEEKIEELYKLAMDMPQGADSQFATNVVQYIKDCWQLQAFKKPSFSGTLVSQNSNLMFVGTQQFNSQTIITQIDRKMTTFKSAFIHFIEKTYRLFHVLLNENVKPTRSDAVSKASAILAGTNIITGVHVPFVGSLEVNISQIMLGIINLCLLVRDELDKRVMQQFCDTFPSNETQRFNEIVSTALKLSVELAPELYHMSDDAIVELANIAVKRIIRYATGSQSHVYSQQPSYLEQSHALLVYAMSGQYSTRPTERKDFTCICQIGMRTPISYSEERSAISKRVGDNGTPTYQAILDHTGWIILKEDDLTFVHPRFGTTAFCMSQSTNEVKNVFKNRELLPRRIQEILDECVEIYRLEINNDTPVIAANIFEYRRQQSSNSQSSMMSTGLGVRGPMKCY